MKYLRLATTNPYYNLAVEEYMLDYADDDVIMLWQNEPSVVVGVNQNIIAEVDMAALTRRGVHPVRRITGGGAVYHDGGNLNYTFIGRAEGGIDFATFSQPIIDALASLGVSVSLSGRNDLCLPDGRKVSGGAQSRRGERVLHHGTLLFDADLEALSEILTPHPDKLVTKAIKSTRSRVANLKELLPELPTADLLMDKIEEYIITTLGAVRTDVPSSDKIDGLTKRNSSKEWLYPERGISSELSVTRERRFPSGFISIEISLRADRIEDILISGDFFGERSVRELETRIKGTTLSSITDTLADINVDEYILGVSSTDLASVIIGT